MADCLYTNEEYANKIRNIAKEVVIFMESKGLTYQEARDVLSVSRALLGDCKFTSEESLQS